MKKIVTALILCVMMLSLAACGHTKSANKLIRETKRNHGAATVVSKTEDPDGATVVLHDKLQDFDYRVTSYMDAFIMDGEEFGSMPGASDDFQYALVDKIKADQQTEINNIEQKYGATFSTDLGPTVYAGDPNSAKQAAIEIADIYQKNNLKHRLDNLVIMAYAQSSYYHDRTGYYGRDEEVAGHIILPKLEWSGADQAMIEEYTYKAKEIDADAEYLRSEIVTFAETGFDLEQVTATGDCPRSEDAPVTLYYFKASDGGEFYIADFCINDEIRPSEFDNANNYDNRTYP